LEGPLKKRIKAGEACWSIDSTDVDLRALKAAASLRQQQQKPHVIQQQAEGSVAASPDTTGMVGGIAGGSSSSSSGGSGGSVVEMCELLLILPKEEGGRYWRALFEGGEEKSHMQVRRLAGGCTGWAVRLGTMSYGFWWMHVTSLMYVGHQSFSAFKDGMTLAPRRHDTFAWGDS
jgi:hypothetical protein